MLAVLLPFIILAILGGGLYYLKNNKGLQVHPPKESGFNGSVPPGQPYEMATPIRKPHMKGRIKMVVRRKPVLKKYRIKKMMERKLAMGNSMDDVKLDMVKDGADPVVIEEVSKQIRRRAS
ncbi:MAG: hypothetical protein KKG59_01420 [Nanoarchaeota archaeon]|nr:hypothetical protein [Nanoarchaeota archaeon]